MNFSPSIQELVSMALSEDIGSGDVTVKGFIQNSKGEGKLLARESLVLSGSGVVKEVYSQVNKEVEVEFAFSDGERVESGQILAYLKGEVSSLLQGERVALNFLQRLSGIATFSRRFVDSVQGTSARILDTRKTTPCFRLLEKNAVKDGGGENHRWGLFDRVMLKDNHFSSLKGENLPALINAFRKEHPSIPIHLEADKVALALEFLNWENIDGILLDNMDLKGLRTIVEKRKKESPLLEASGNISLKTVREVALTGVDFISVGALTHSFPSADISLDF